MRIAQVAPLWERVPPPAYGMQFEGHTDIIAGSETLEQIAVLEDKTNVVAYFC